MKDIDFEDIWRYKVMELLNKFYIFALTTPILALARKPAVEDFVGVESIDYRPSSGATDVLFNFSDQIPEHASNGNSEILTVFTLIAFIALPFLMWTAMTKTKKAKKSKPVVRVTKMSSPQTIQTDTPNNIEYLKDHKKKTKKQDQIKKAS
ncbi:MAG: hypothetical protein N4A33_01295 [Bacteriovoracaceae bacterium]|nr:hypothetical protein [Bacteriovoracaceae bacterium]